MITLVIPATLIVALIVLYIKDFGFAIRTVGFVSVISLAIIVPVFSYLGSRRMINDMFPEIAKKISNQGPQFTKSDVIAFHEVAVGIFVPFVTWFFVAIIGMFLAGILVGKGIQLEDRK